jgi:hypothetical protein
VDSAGSDSVREFGIDPDAREFKTVTRVKPTTTLAKTNATTRESSCRPAKSLCGFAA